MKTEEKTKSTRARIRDLDIGSKLVLDRASNIPSSIRSTVVSIACDTNQKYEVSVSNDSIIVTRKS